MSEPRCPHCQTVLPEQATFCAACGNRIEGWSIIPAGAGVPVGDKPEKLPGGQEPTTNMQPTPSLLRAAALSKKPAETKKPTKTGPVETDSAMMRTVKQRPVPLLIVLAGVAVLAAGLAYFIASRPSEPPPPAAAVTAPPPPSPAAVSGGLPQAPPPA